MGRRVGEPLALWTRYPQSSRIADIVEKHSPTHGTTTTVVHTAQVGETIGPLEQAVDKESKEVLYLTIMAGGRQIGATMTMTAPLTALKS